MVSCIDVIFVNVGILAGMIFGCWREAFVLAVGVADADDADALFWRRVAQHVRARGAS